jgi:hypothetical protein
LLGEFANEAAIALDLLQRAREARAVLEDEGGDAAAVARFVAKLGEASPERREAVMRLLESIEALLPASSSALDENF